MAFPTTGVLDNFNRVDEGSPPSASWVNSLSAGLAVVSNTVKPASTDDGSTWNTSFAADQECFVTLATQLVAINDAFNVVVRSQTATDFFDDHYDLEPKRISGSNNDVFEIWERSGGSWTQLGADVALGADMALGDQVGIDISGSTITVYLNGTSKGTRSDSTISGAGFVGLAFEAANGEALDDFGGGAIVVSSTRRVFTVS